MCMYIGASDKISEKFLRRVHAFTHWGRGKIAAISQSTYTNAFSWMKFIEFRLKFHWSLFLKVQSKICQPILIQIMAWCWSGDKPLSKLMMLRLPTRICITRTQWLKFLVCAMISGASFLFHGDVAYWRKHTSMNGAVLVKVTGCRQLGVKPSTEKVLTY